MSLEQRIRDAVASRVQPAALAEAVIRLAVKRAAESPEIGGGVLWIFTSPLNVTGRLPEGVYPNRVRVVWYGEEVKCEVRDRFPLGPEAYARWEALRAASALEAAGYFDRNMVEATLLRDKRLRASLSSIRPPLPEDLVLTDILRSGPWGAWVEALPRAGVCEDRLAGSALAYFFVDGVPGLSVLDPSEGWEVVTWRVAHRLRSLLGVRPEAFMDWADGRISRDEWEAEVAMARLGGLL